MGSESAACSNNIKPPLRGPKVRGCYSCSQRRIDCDRTSPSCLKCQKKGIECFGLPGARFRFVSKSVPGAVGGAAKKGRSFRTSSRIQTVTERPKSCADELCSIPALESEASKQLSFQISEVEHFATMSSIEPESSTGIYSPHTFSSPWLLDLGQPPLLLDPIQPIINPICTPTGTMDKQSSDSQSGSDDVTVSDSDSIENIASFLGLNTSQRSVFDPPIDHMCSVERFFISYFSQHVAPVMVVIDEKFNGYRDLVLSLTETVSHVRNAVIAAGAHHFALRAYFPSDVAQRYYTRSIDQLLYGSETGFSLPLVDNTSIASLVVLLICNMITGRDDFKTLFSTLRCSLKAHGERAIAKDKLGLFLLQQTQKMQLYANPQLSEEEGVEWVSVQMPYGLDFLYAAKRGHPDHAENISQIIFLVKMACDIYLHRALNDVEVDMTIGIVEEFRAAAEALPQGAKGAHVLVWAYFVVAAESSTWEHRLFFINKLQLLYATTGFANTLSAIQLLSKMWAKHKQKRWTYSLGISSETFIM